MKLSRLLSIVKLGIDVLLSEHLQSRCIDSSMYRYTPNAYSREIALWDTNCRLARHYKWFLHHVLTVNQGLTNLPSNRALNNVLKSSD